jgi:hypothetical protein
MEEMSRHDYINMVSGLFKKKTLWCGENAVYLVTGMSFGCITFAMEEISF